MPKETRYIVIELFDHTTDEQAQEYAQEIQDSFQFHYEPFVVKTHPIKMDRIKIA